MDNPEPIKYPVNVFFNGRIVGNMNYKGVITFTDQSAVNQVMEMIEGTATGIIYKDSNGKPFKDNAVHIGKLGKEEDNKMEMVRVKEQKRNGRIL